MQDDPDGDRPSLLGQLGSRGVLRAAVIYLAGAWGVIEVADTVFPRLGFPDWTVTLVIWLAILAFPVVLGLAWSFDLTREGLRRSDGRGTEPIEEAGTGRGPALAGSFGMGKALVALVATGGVAGLAWALWLRPPPAPSGSLDPETVAVLPFRTAGASPDLEYLREGMVDLLSAKLTGEVGPRAVDPGTVVSAWRRATGDRPRALPVDSAREVARTVGAGRTLVGSVVGTPSALVVSASLAETAGGGSPVTAEVEGPADSLPSLVDRLTGVLLARSAGDGIAAASLTTTSLPALRAYLIGEAEYRRGRYEAAIERFEEAVEIDSTFALAGLGMHRSGGWLAGRKSDQERGRRIAWTHRDRLPAPERAFLEARVGPGYPGYTSGPELLAARRRAVELMPDRAEVWYELADFHFHWGSLLGEPDPLERAFEGFRRALELDPYFSPSLLHAVTLAAAVGDTAYLGELRDLQVGRDSTGATSLYVLWRDAFTRRDTALLSRYRDLFPDWPTPTLRWIAVDLQQSGLPATDGRRGVEVRASRVGTTEERRERLLGVHSYALNGGRPREALRALEELERLGLEPERGYADRRRLLDAIFGDGDEAAAEGAATRLERRLEARDPGGVSPIAARDRCLLSLWRLHRGRSDSGEAAVRAARRIRRAAEAHGDLDHRHRLCAAALEAWGAAAGSVERREALAALEETLLDAPYREITDVHDPYWASLVLARLFEEGGRHRRALDATRRWVYFNGWQRYVSTFFLTRARLAARLGEREEAIAGYRAYLNLRPDPEPAILPDVERVRSELDALLSSRPPPSSSPGSP